MNIQQESGENVSELVTKIYQICKCIMDMVKASNVPCAKVFLETTTLAFNIEAVSILNDAQMGTATWAGHLPK